jgi:hypothetical protein
MGIIGEHPESGVRIDVERPLSGGPPWRYEGEAVTPTGRHRVVVVVEEGGTVHVQGVEAAAPLAPEPVRLLMRAVWRHAHAEGAPPPRRVVRWRPDR